MRSKPPTVNASLTEALREVAADRLQSGLYGNASESVRELIRCEEAASRPLRALHQAGLDSGDSTPMSDADWEALRAVARPPAAAKA